MREIDPQIDLPIVNVNSVIPGKGELCGICQNGVTFKMCMFEKSDIAQNDKFSPTYVELERFEFANLEARLNNQWNLHSIKPYCTSFVESGKKVAERERLARNCF